MDDIILSETEQLLIYRIVQEALNNISKHASARFVEIVIVRESEGLLIRVSDDGRGIPRQDLDRIFERFYQSDAARSGEGTGLGLAIARWIAQEHGGRVFAANNPQGGAAFTVELPVAKS